MRLFGGKRVTTNMAEVSVDCSNTTKVIERSKSESVNLREEDVPGAILPREIPEECTVKQLQRWLLCRIIIGALKKVLPPLID